MTKADRMKTVMLYCVFFFYIILLIKILFLSRVSLPELFNPQRTIERSLNWIPFYSISQYLSGGTENLKRFAFGNVVGNILVFIPLGAYLTVLRKNKKVLPNLLFVFIVSLSVEIMQGILGIGAADIDDILLNCLGGLAGILGLRFLLLILCDEKSVRNVITLY